MPSAVRTFLIPIARDAIATATAIQRDYTHFCADNANVVDIGQHRPHIAPSGTGIRGFASVVGVEMPGCYRAVVEPLESRTLYASITVDASQRFQTIAGLGGNFARAKYGDFYIESNDKVGQYALANLKPQHARVGIPLRGWEPVNDDLDPASMNLAGFATTNTTVVGVFQLMQDLNRRGIPMTASVWDAPNWMLTNPTSKNQRVVPAGNYAELIESIASFLKRAQDTYGVRVQYLSFNESDGGYNLKFSATEQAAFIAQAGQAFARLGLDYTPLWLVGDTGNAQRLVNYATPILNNAAAAPYLGPISFHGWDSLTYPDTTLTAIAALGRQYNKPVWCEEVGSDAGAFSASPSPFPTWTYALNLAQTYLRLMKLADVSVADYWEMQNDFPLLATGSTTTLYPAYFIVNGLMQNFTPGTQMIAADSDTAGVLSMAGINPLGSRVSIEAINTTSTAQTVTINGLPAGMSFALTRSSANENAVSGGTFSAAGGSLAVTLPAGSVSMFSTVPLALVAAAPASPIPPILVVTPPPVTQAIPGLPADALESNEPWPKSEPIPPHHVPRRVHPSRTISKTAPR